MMSKTQFWVSGTISAIRMRGIRPRPQHTSENIP